ncbi:MAG: hypothetical protein LUD80_00640 [Clostridiales bacterium]|nr:hypothetical protein [Clostridiales bacterium]
MSGGELFQLGAIAVAGTFCALTLRRQTPELALLLALVTGGLLLWRSREPLESALSLFRELAGSLAALVTVAPLLRAVLELVGELL